VGRIKVLRENKANMNIEAENMKQEEEAREEMMAVAESLMQRRAEEGTTELEEHVRQLR
jgi:hypothetical protein